MGLLQKEHRRRSIWGQHHCASRYFILAVNPGASPDDPPEVLLAWTKSKAAAAAAFPALAIALNDADRFRMEKILRKGDLESGSAVKVTTKVLGAVGQLHECTLERIGLNELLITGEQSGSTRSRKLLLRAGSNIARDGWYTVLKKALEPMRADILPTLSGSDGEQAPSVAASPTQLHNTSVPPHTSPLLRGVPLTHLDATTGTARKGHGDVRRQSIGPRRVSISDASELTDNKEIAMSALISPTSVEPILMSGLDAGVARPLSPAQRASPDAHEGASTGATRRDYSPQPSPPRIGAAPPPRALTQQPMPNARRPLPRGALRGKASTNRRNSAPSFRAFFAAHDSPTGTISVASPRPSPRAVRMTGGASPARGNGAAPSRAPATTSKENPAHRSTTSPTNGQEAQLQFLLDSAAITRGEFHMQMAALGAVQPSGMLHAGAAATEQTSRANSVSREASQATMQHPESPLYVVETETNKEAQAGATREVAQPRASQRAAPDGAPTGFETAAWQGDAEYTDAVNAMQAAARPGSARSPPQWYEALRDESAMSKSSSCIYSEVDAATEAVAGLLRLLRAKCDTSLEVRETSAPPPQRGHPPRFSEGAPNMPDQRVTVARTPSQLRHENELVLNHMEAPAREVREDRLHLIGYVPDPWLPPDAYRAERDERRARLHRLRLRQDALLEEIAAESPRTLRASAESTVSSGEADVGGIARPWPGDHVAMRKGSRGNERGEERSAAVEMPALQPSRARSSALCAEIDALDAVLAGTTLAGAASGNAESDADITTSGAVLDTAAFLAADQWHAVARLEEPAPSAAVAARCAARETHHGAELAARVVVDAELERWISAEVRHVERSGYGGGTGGAATKEGCAFKLDDDDWDSGGFAAELRDEIEHIHAQAREGAAAAEGLYVKQAI